MSLWLAIARRAFRRYSTYRAATLAGIFTNSVFGIIHSFVFLAVWTAAPGAGGYSAQDAVTYVWLGQALIMTTALWGGGTTEDLAERIRTGDVVIDLYRPVGLIGWYLAGDLGRAAYHLLTRGLAPLLLGALLFDLTAPSGVVGVVAVLVSVALAVVVSFAIRFLVACLAFWLLDAIGPRLLALVLATFFSGMAVPLVIFPDGLREVALVLPWASLLQTPADIWLGQREGWSLLGGLGLQAGWAVALLALCSLVLARATRKVVVQGG
ncbi:ABC transporter permease [Nocardioides sp. zg-579]|uniref:ABC transporter permease n=1 Tax=Nocardioides marmotae TaxID=2663857 RepID=A0A6I3J877_9ACTN|nr:ABC-2 family transporter protein [Nocardioides marmotae]MCR6030943.1 ABC transporter permease [Gordonia jinghuaiqii]MTB94579.1 ABC transporter permease [Nocardioides marmotae]QKE01409.1 ABC transporter permease [Nocardioides marmotae]